MATDRRASRSLADQVARQRRISPSAEQLPRWATAEAASDTISQSMGQRPTSRRGISCGADSSSGRQESPVSGRPAQRGGVRRREEPVIDFIRCWNARRARAPRGRSARGRGGRLLAARPAHGQPAGSVQGTVVDEGGGAPLAAAVVTLEELGLSIATGPDGTFSIDDVPAGNYCLTVTREGFAPLTSRVTVTAGSSRSAIAGPVLRDGIWRARPNMVTGSRLGPRAIRTPSRSCARLSAVLRTQVEQPSRNRPRRRLPVFRSANGLLTSQVSTSCAISRRKMAGTIVAAQRSAAVSDAGRSR